MRMQAGSKVIKVQAQVKFQTQTPHNLRFEAAPHALKGLPAQIGLVAARCLEDGMRIGADALSPFAARLFGAQPFRLFGQIVFQLVVHQGPFEAAHFMHDTALLPRLGKVAGDCARQAGAAITHHELDTSWRKAARDKSAKQLLPRSGILGRRGLIVQDLSPTIGPHPHHRQHYALHAAHVLPLMPALIRPGFASGHEYLHPHSINQQHRRRVRDGCLVPGFHRRVGRA